MFVVTGGQQLARRNLGNSLGLRRGRCAVVVLYHYKMIAAIRYSLRVVAAPCPCCTMRVDCVSGTTKTRSESVDVLTEFATTLDPPIRISVIEAITLGSILSQPCVFSDRRSRVGYF